METSTATALTRTIDEPVAMLQFASKKTKQFFASIKTRLAQFYRKVSYVFYPGTSHAIVKIEHLHTSCRNMESPKRKVFYMYVKGYSMSEISAQSGTKRYHIIATIHNILKDMHKETYVS